MMSSRGGQAQILRGIEQTSVQLSELEALVKRRLAFTLLRLEAGLLLLEARMLLLALREDASMEQPKRRIETVGEFEAALLVRPH